MKYIWLSVVLSALLWQGALAQNTFVQFGKNRVQYKTRDWRNFSTANFDVYYYDNGVRLANFATSFLDTEFNKIADMIGYTPYFKSRIFIYNSISDLQQSNLGIEDNNVVTGGQTDFYKSQVEIPYTGSEVEFKRELRRGVALMLIKEMMFGGHLKEMLQAAYLGKFSEWFIFGAAEYVASGWSEEMDDRLRDLFNTRRTKKPNLFEGRDAILLGQSMWNFIVERYGASNFSSILNLARITRNERNSIGYAIGVRYNTFLEEWRKYYQLATNETNEYTTTEPEYDFRLRRNNRKGWVFNEFKVNPEGSRIAYSENRGGKYRVVVQDLRTRKRKVLLKGGYKAINQRFDDNIPLLSWRDNQNLGIMYNRKGENKLVVLNQRRKRSYERMWFYFNHVSSFDFSDDGNMIIFSADRKGELNFKTGQSDIFVFDMEITNLEQVTDDWFDDKDPQFLPGSRTAFVFSSNRLTDSLSSTLISNRGNYKEEVNNFDIFIYNPQVSRTQVSRLTSSPASEIQPRMLDQNNILFLSEDNGIMALKRYQIADNKTFTLTNFRQSVRVYEPNPFENGLAYLMIRKGRLYPYYKKNFDFGRDLSVNYQTPRRRLLAQRAAKNALVVEQPKRIPVGFTDSSRVALKPNEVYGKDEINTDDYVFEADVVKERQSPIEKVQNTMLDRIKEANKAEMQVRGPYDYKSRFRSDNVVFTPIIDPFRNLGLVMNLNTAEMLENHKIKGGLTTFLNLRSSSFFAEYQYLTKRFDFSLRFDRQNYYFNDNNLITVATPNTPNAQQLTVPLIQKHVSNRLQASLSFPISNLHRVSISPFYLTTNHAVTGDYLIISAPLYLTRTNRYEYGGLKLEYVYDDSRIIGQNMIVGTRVKAYYEEYRGLNMSRHVSDINRAFGANISANALNFHKISIDARHYIRIHREITLALRSYFGSFGGNNPKIFALGGMDNWIGNQRDPSDFAVTTNQTIYALTADQGVAFGNEDMVFTEFVTNLRGFNYARMSGRNVLINNVELRFPIFKYLFGKRLNSNFLNNFQLVGFYDLGTAWSDTNPFRSESASSFRTVGVATGPNKTTFLAQVNDFTNPWLQSYGAGLRTVLLGYYAKLDLAWPVEDFVVAKNPRLFFTFGYDF